MFDNFVQAKTQKRRKWVGVVISVSAILHLVVIAAMTIRAFWVIEKLSPPDTEVTLGAPPPPPPPPPAGSKKQEKRVTKSIKKVKETVQPDKEKEKKPDEVDSTDDSEDDGVEGGVEGGVKGGVVGGVLGGVEGGVLGGQLGAPPAPAAAAPTIVPQKKLNALRISGVTQIAPPNNVAILIERSGKPASGNFKLCLTAGGSVKSVTTAKSSGYPKWDSKIKREMKRWKYRPFRVNGKPVPVCSYIVFIVKF